MSAIEMGGTADKATPEDAYTQGFKDGISAGKKRIEKLETELAEYKDTLSLVRRSKNSQYRRIEKLEAKLAEANKKATQRGARMQIMKEWMELYRCDADYLTIWDRLIGERPEAKDLFDKNGVPR